MFLSSRCIILVLILFATNALAEVHLLNESKSSISPAVQSAYDKVRNGFCDNKKLLRCLKLEVASCTVNIDRYLDGCINASDKSVTESRDEQFLKNYFFGCAYNNALRIQGTNVNELFNCMSQK